MSIYDIVVLKPSFRQLAISESRKGNSSFIYFFANYIKNLRLSSTTEFSHLPGRARVQSVISIFLRGRGAYNLYGIKVKIIKRKQKKKVE